MVYSYFVTPTQNNIPGGFRVVKTEKTILINMSELNGSELPLRSVRRSSIELRLVRFIARRLYSESGDSIWRTDRVLIAYEPNHDLLGLIQFDRDGVPDTSHILVLDGVYIMRSLNMGETQIFNALKSISLSEEWKVSDSDETIVWMLRY